MIPRLSLVLATLLLTLFLSGVADVEESPPSTANGSFEATGTSERDRKPSELPFVSHNSGLADGIAESGQPILITLVDNAAAELANVARNVDTISDSLLSPNYSDSLDEIEKKIEAKATLELPETNATVATESSVEATKEIKEEQNDTLPSESSSPPLNTNTTEEAEPKPPTEVQEDIPSFSEWAQKQLEEAEKNKETVLNDSSKSPHKLQISNNNIKVRSKNYASPDCGAKIIAANPEAGSAGFILSPSRDEYMLNTCNSRIWFIVELCEAIQAKKIELANFELFSSTPKNFTVSVSDRFPTREWAGVGQFIAKDERDIQTFNLHPHLFGKFMKVELHSHYGSEHYCPISLFRVYGTSEYEVFETENAQNVHDDDDDDVLEGLSEVEKDGDISRNLFGSARDAVMSIMKKAAEVLVKSSDSKNSTLNLDKTPSVPRDCRTPSHILVCDNCSNFMFQQVYDLISCETEYVERLVNVPMINDVLWNSDMCQSYGFVFGDERTSIHRKTKIAAYVSTILMPSYVAALCNMLAIMEKKVVLNVSFEADLNVTTNLTIDKKSQTAVNEGLIEEIIQEPFRDDGKKIPESRLNENVNIAKEQDKAVPETKPEELSNDTKAVNSTNDNIVDTSVNNDTAVVTDPVESTSKAGDEVVEDAKVEEKKNQSESVVQGDVNLIKDNNSNNSTNDTDESNTILLDDNNTSQEQLVLDSLLNEYDQVGESTPAPNVVSTPLQGQKESVFLRLSNRIKALEKNMSLSGQYLEELSRRYKKQVEEMQKTFEKTVLAINEESKRAEERDQKNSEEMLVLQQQIAQLSTSVSMLLAERESWLGNVTVFKVIVLQIIITVLVVYFCKRTYRSNEAVVMDTVDVKKLRRLSAEETGNVSVDFSKKRRSSEDDIVYASKNDQNNANLPKKRKRKKSNGVQRSVSMVAAPEMLQIKSEIKAESKDWALENMNSNMDLPVALEEAEFIPEVEPIDFSKMGENAVAKHVHSTPKKEFPITNGSIMNIINKKPPKVRRLSSPAFFKSPIKQSVNNHDNQMEEVKFTPVSPSLSCREVKSEENQPAQMTEWSSVSELSQTSISTTSSTSKPKKSKKASFKNMLKKVF